MKIDDIKIQSIHIPFKVSFKHSSAIRTQTETLVALVRTIDDIEGYGEGCPRGYVTGETVEPCIKFLASYKKEIRCIHSMGSLKTFVDQYQLIINDNPAAWCAIETALLDALGQYESQSIEGLAGLPEITDRLFFYTAVLGVSNTQQFQAQLLQYIQFGFEDFKLKISGDIETDTTNVQAVLKACPEARIRLDGNNIWSNATEAQIYLNTLPSVFWAVEEPIAKGDYQGLLDIAKNCQCQIILDESFLRIEQFDYIKNNEHVWILNIRLSKMGGLLRSLDIANLCQQHKVPFIVGAQVGETSILTRLALAVVNTYPDDVLGQEGAFGTYLLERDIAVPSLVFSNKGQLKFVSNSEANCNYGLGLKINV